LADLQHLAFVAAAGPQRAVGSGDDGPEKRRRRFREQRSRWPEENAAVAIDRQVFDIPFQEVGLRRDVPERRRGGGEGNGGGENRRPEEPDGATDGHCRAPPASTSMASTREPMTA